jgi:hypothetical protein
MNIGELINKFDNETDGTVASFNKVFSMCPLSSKYAPESVVDIGAIVGIGKVDTRFLTVNNERLEHVFSVIDRCDIAENSNRGKSLEYTIKKDGKVVFICTTRKEIEKKLDIGYSRLQRMLKENHVYQGYSISTKVLDKAPEKKPNFKFIVEIKNKEPMEFIGIRSITEYFKVSQATIHNWARGKTKRAGVKVTRISLKEDIDEHR